MNGKPTIIIAKTIIGKGIEQVQGTNAAHGEAGVAYVNMGYFERFYCCHIPYYLVVH